MSDQHIRLVVDGQEILKLSPGGVVEVRGERVDDNQQVYEAFRSWLDVAQAPPRVWRVYGEVVGGDHRLVVAVDEARAIEKARLVGRAMRVEEVKMIADVEIKDLGLDGVTGRCRCPGSSPAPGERCFCCGGLG